ncbi:amino acid ABC transporter substrate-binding protein [Paenarthrobacter nicotinovorans]|uniref:amino acid ABC transporter substrate-binding protein n=1 Tax=Paenarthrobacter nicotinovorans TaxID=29320 RepID=UPI00166CBF80|nr:amino acid ABC transporter substrate-binding protein [Paenarthrobacter nicotinovorans]MBP2393648.1 cystine transport system substrate-binding protein [Paenarthrobacter nicotinovorans]UKF00104.1 amino acid ABC transporter substrate-binding protein [Paenarthrobacter nicotinovorans]UKF04886.1 amino acid ABC transporter substrate-binding protein [Paenarthrobacter nicotinovorans]GGV33714.1 L-cystine-binding protein TcyA [Paenarthrobacter nicotinovorans]
MNSLRTRRSILAATLASAALALSACGGGSTPAQSGGDTSLSDVKSKGELVIVTEGTYRPFSFHAEGAGDLTGFDVEIAQAVAGKLGVKASFQETQFDGIFAGLDSKRFDTIANQISINDDRKAKYEFSTPYTISTGVVVTKSDNSSINSFADLKGKTTAQSLTSNFYKMAVEAGANVQAVEGWAQSATLVQQGRVDATVNDKLTYLDYAKTTPDSGLKVAAEAPDKTESAFVFRKGSSELTKAVDKALEDLRADGTLAKISDKYFGADVTK